MVEKYLDETRGPHESGNASPVASPVASPAVDAKTSADGDARNAGDQGVDE